MSNPTAPKGFVLDPHHSVPVDLQFLPFRTQFGEPVPFLRVETGAVVEVDFTDGAGIHLTDGTTVDASLRVWPLIRVPETPPGMQHKDGGTLVRGAFRPPTSGPTEHNGEIRWASCDLLGWAWVLERVEPKRERPALLVAVDETGFPVAFAVAVGSVFEAIGFPTRRGDELHDIHDHSGRTAAEALGPWLREAEGELRVRLARFVEDEEDPR